MNLMYLLSLQCTIVYPGQFDVRCLFWLTLLYTCFATSYDKCSRLQSRTVRTLISERVYPILEDYGASISATCSLNPRRDYFAVQESNKFMENVAKWHCSFCGKSFHEERFLDLHFENRHSDKLYKGSHGICLADYCDVFRCDVIEKRERPNYWEMALCKDNDLHILRHQCENLFRACLPAHISESKKLKLLDALNTSVCSFLTCDSYWDLPEAVVEPVNAAIYILLFLFICVVLVIYYLLVCAHFYEESNKDRTVDDGIHYIPGYAQAPDGSLIRHRVGHS